MSALNDAVVRYLAEKFGRIHPIPTREKGPRIKNWQDPTRTFAVEDFGPDDNIGTALTGDLVDIDLDCPEAVEIAPHYLAPTGRIHGRQSKPWSHYFYRITGADTFKFRDIPRIDPATGKKVTATILEIRAGAKHQTIIPPSIHPSGEHIAWAEPFGDPAAWEAESCWQQTRYMAAAVILGRHWPDGSRHDAALAVGGFFASRQVPLPDAETIIGDITKISRDEESSDRLRAVRETYASFSAGREVTGLPRISELIGDEVGRLLGKWFTSKKAIADGFITTESGDAEALAAYGADVVRFDHRRDRWLVINRETGIWQPDGAKRVEGMAKLLMRFQQRQANEIQDHDQRKKIWKWYFDGENRNRLTNCLHLARKEPPVSSDGDEWDLDPFLLGCRNGVINLRTGELRPALPEEHVTMRVAVAYDPDATCPLFERTIREIFTFDASADAPEGGLSFTESPEDRAESLVSFIQRAIGYTLTGDVREECFFICWGTGRNGKATIINLMYWLLGAYADNLSMSTLEVHAFESGGGAPRPDIAKLPGKRMVTASENKKTAILNEELIKRVTGRDPLTVRPLYKPEFTFEPVFKLWMMVNNKPGGIHEDDVAMWARIHLIPFLRCFTGCEDKTLKDRLREEAPGILAWAVRGAMAWQREGLNPPDAVRAATQQYRAESDVLLQFVDECCMRSVNASTRTGDLLRAYQRWCGNRNERPVFNHKTLTPALVGRGFSIDAKRPKAFTWLVGIGLLEETPTGAGGL